MKELDGAIEHFDLEMAADKYIVTMLTKAMKPSTKNNAALTSQLNDALHLNIDMAKKINVKTMQDT